MGKTLGLKNVNMLTKEQYGGIAEPAADELYAISGSGFGLPSDRYIDLTLGASGSTYTAPANGWFYLQKVAGQTTTTTVNMYNNSASTLAMTCGLYGNASYIANVFVPAKKGDEVYISYQATGNTNKFRFVYAEGE